MNDIAKFREIAMGILDESDRKSIGIGEISGELEESMGISETMITSYNNTRRGNPLEPIQGKDSDGELVFIFEDKEDAYDMYDFVIESGLVVAGEVVYRDIEEQYSVAFMPSVVVNKPEVIHAALLAYEEQLYTESEEDDEQFESFISGFTDLLLEAPTKTSGAPKRKAKMGNPFHNKHTGKFSGAGDHVISDGGSWAIKKTKLKLTGKGKTKEGGLLAKYGSTKHPCGRAARAQGKNIRCWDGKTGAGARLAKIMKKKKAKKESIDAADMSLLMEMRAMYGAEVM